MAFPVALAIGAGAKLLGGLFGGRAKKKKAEAARKAEIEGLNLKQTMAEDKRLGNVNAGASLLGSIAGLPQISPEALAALKQRRTYDFSKAVPEAAGMGSELLSGLFGAVGDVADMYGANRQDADGDPAPRLSGSIQAGTPINTKLGGGTSPISGTGWAADRGITGSGAYGIVQGPGDLYGNFGGQFDAPDFD